MMYRYTCVSYSHYQFLDVQVLVLEALDHRLEQRRQILPQSHLRNDLLQRQSLLVETPRVQRVLELLQLATFRCFEVSHSGLLKKLNCINNQGYYVTIIIKIISIPSSKRLTGRSSKVMVKSIFGYCIIKSEKIGTK